MELPPGYGRIGQEPSALICRFKEGDESSLEDILTLYGPYTQRFLSRTRLELSMDDIDDILSETLAEAWINREFYDPSRSKFKSWFNAIAKNKAKYLIAERSKRKDTLHIQDVFNNGEPVSHDEKNHHTTQGGRSLLSKLDRKILGIIRKFKLSDKLILIEHANAKDKRNWTANLAEKLNVNQTLIRVRFKRIKDKIKKELKEAGFELTDDNSLP